MLSFDYRYLGIVPMQGKAKGRGKEKGVVSCFLFFSY
jgi:hypothetical protein